MRERNPDLLLHAAIQLLPSFMNVGHPVPVAMREAVKQAAAMMDLVEEFVIGPPQAAPQPTQNLPSGALPPRSRIPMPQAAVPTVGTEMGQLGSPGLPRAQE